ncbi:MAG: hypothetical protein ABI837_18240 [Acidobacteriota bacterium]
MSTTASWRFQPEPLAEALRRWQPKSAHDRNSVNEALMDLVVYPFDRGVEDRQHPGVFEWDAGNGVVIVFVPDPNLTRTASAGSQWRASRMASSRRLGRPPFIQLSCLHRQL